MVLLQVSKPYQMVLKSQLGDNGNASGFLAASYLPLGSWPPYYILHFSMTSSSKPIKIPVECILNFMIEMSKKFTVEVFKL